MEAKKFEKYIITKPKEYVEPQDFSPGGPGFFVNDRMARVMYLDDDVLKGAFYVECVWIYKPSPEGTGPKTHTHDFDEIIAFFGSNPDDPTDLCGEVELWLGGEKHIIKKSCVVFVPKGLEHCPMRFLRVDRPIFHFTAGPTSKYGGKKK